MLITSFAMSRTLKRLAQEKARIRLRLFAFTAVDHWYSLDLLILSSCYWWYIGYILFKTKILWLSAVLVSTYSELTGIIEVGSTLPIPSFLIFRIRAIFCFLELARSVSSFALAVLHVQPKEERWQSKSPLTNCPAKGRPHVGPSFSFCV